MTRLIYGIVREQVFSTLEIHEGPGGSPISLVTANGIAAVSTPILKCPSGLDSDSVLAFSRVVAAFHAQGVILPVRYGTCAESEMLLQQWLEKRKRSILAAIQEIDGCEEMGLKAIWSAPELAKDEPSNNRGKQGSDEVQASAPAGTESCRVGTDYLMRLRERYDKAATVKQAKARAVETLKDAFSGLFVRFEAEERDDPDRGSLSLHFLTLRRDRERFLTAYRELHERWAGALLLTGPWPPYHFASVLMRLEDLSPSD